MPSLKQKLYKLAYKKHESKRLETIKQNIKIAITAMENIASETESRARKLFEAEMDHDTFLRELDEYKQDVSLIEIRSVFALAQWTNMSRKHLIEKDLTDSDSESPESDTESRGRGSTSVKRIDVKVDRLGQTKFNDQIIGGENDLSVDNISASEYDSFDEYDAFEQVPKVSDDSGFYAEESEVKVRSPSIKTELPKKSKKEVELAFPAPEAVVNQFVLKPGSFGKGYVSHVISPKAFWIQYNPNEALNAIYAIQTAQDMLYQKGVKNLDSYLTGTLCAAKFKTDELWYRAKIINCRSRDDKVRVYYVDWGNDDEVSIDWLMPLDDSLRDHPARCVKCCLSDYNEDAIVDVEAAHRVFKTFVSSSDSTFNITYHQSLTETNGIEKTKVYDVTLHKPNSEDVRRKIYEAGGLKP
ncbi:Tudor domain-containing protein 1 [Halotydeus destructor]|nr:Tudor domain-containing protein 1 [Halotydeus destructor]